MGRPLRLLADGLVYHALNRGNRAPVFFEAADYQLFLQALAQTKSRYPFRLYAFCLMGNHFHLVLEPDVGQSISRILQALTVAHTWHYHRMRATTERRVQRRAACQTLITRKPKTGRPSAVTPGSAMACR